MNFSSVYAIKQSKAKKNQSQNQSQKKKYKFCAYISDAGYRYLNIFAIKLPKKNYYHKNYKKKAKIFSLFLIKKRQISSFFLPSINHCIFYLTLLQKRFTGNQKRLLTVVCPSFLIALNFFTSILIKKKHWFWKCVFNFYRWPMFRWKKKTPFWSLYSFYWSLNLSFFFFHFTFFCSSFFSWHNSSVLPDRKKKEKKGFVEVENYPR